MIPRNVENQLNPNIGNWHDLSLGVPTLFGFAMLAGRALAGLTEPVRDLSHEARVILFVAGQRGIIEIRGQPDLFDSTERLLSVSVETDEGRWLLFKKKSEPHKTLAYLEGFRQLCQSGFVMHHLQREFSLTKSGFDLAANILATSVQADVEWAGIMEY